MSYLTIFVIRLSECLPTYYSEIQDFQDIWRGRYLIKTFDENFNQKISNNLIECSNVEWKSIDKSLTLLAMHR